MVTDVLINYLKDENVDMKMKYAYLERLKLSYSDLFELLEIFKYEDKIVQLISPFVSYGDSKSDAKIRKQQKDIKNRIKQKKMKRVRREKSYD